MSSAVAYGSVYVNQRCFREDRAKSSKARKACVCKSVALTPQSLQYEKTKVQMPEKSVRIGVLGASGYTGSESIHSFIPEGKRLHRIAIQECTKLPNLRHELLHKAHQATDSRTPCKSSRHKNPVRECTKLPNPRHELLHKAHQATDSRTPCKSSRHKNPVRDKAERYQTESQHKPFGNKHRCNHNNNKIQARENICSQGQASRAAGRN